MIYSYFIYWMIVKLRRLAYFINLINTKVTSRWLVLLWVFSFLWKRMTPWTIGLALHLTVSHIQNSLMVLLRALFHSYEALLWRKMTPGKCHKKNSHHASTLYMCFLYCLFSQNLHYHTSIVSSLLSMPRKTKIQTKTKENTIRKIMQQSPLQLIVF